MSSSGADRWNYRSVDGEIRHFRIVSEKCTQLQGELVRSLQDERQQRRDLEIRLQHALESERLERERSQSQLVSALEYVRLDKMAIKLRDENQKLKEEVQEMRARAEVEASVAAARTAAWEERLREAERRVEQEQQAAKEVAREAREQAEQRGRQERQAQGEAYAKQVDAMRRSHQEELEALRAEIESIRNECNEQVNVAALEFEERSAQQSDSIAALEADKTALRDQLSGSLARASLLQARLDEVQRSLESERTRVLEANRTILALRQAAEAQHVRFQPASSVYPPLAVERLRQNAPSAPPPAPSSQPQPRRARRRAFPSDRPRQQEPQPTATRTAPSLFTFKRRSVTPPAPFPPPPPLPVVPDDFRRQLARLPASKQRWTVPPAPPGPQRTPHSAVLSESAAPTEQRQRNIGEELEATRLFFSGRASALGILPSDNIATINLEDVSDGNPSLSPQGCSPVRDGDNPSDSDHEHPNTSGDVFGTPHALSTPLAENDSPTYDDRSRETSSRVRVPSPAGRDSGDHEGPAEAEDSQPPAGHSESGTPAAEETKVSHDFPVNGNPCRNPCEAMCADESLRVSVEPAPDPISPTADLCQEEYRAPQATSSGSETMRAPPDGVTPKDNTFPKDCICVDTTELEDADGAAPSSPQQPGRKKGRKRKLLPLMHADEA